jgi:hypothetical protein
MPNSSNGDGFSLIHSSTYNSLQKIEDNILLGKNIAFLFCDEINVPYAGTTGGGSVSHADNTSWSGSTGNYLDRPAAVSYQNLQSVDINTDQRGGINQGVELPSTYPTSTNQGYNYDIPVGFVALDKGFVVITHPDLVENFDWSEGDIDGAPEVGGAPQIHLVSLPSSGSSISFYDFDVDYKTTVVTTALPGEFHFSSNPTWDYETNLIEYQLGSNNFQDTYVTEIGLYNKNDELIAVAKLDRPKLKGYLGVLTFSLQIDV